MFGAVLVANRGAVAARIIRACRSLGIRSVAVYSDADAGLPYLSEADEAHLIGPGPPRESYLDQDRLLRVAAERNADAVHPGYGFLSENARLRPARWRRPGRVFIGPRPSLIEAMGEKTRARALMAERGLPVAAGSAVLGDDPADAAAAASAIGYPVLVKPAGGGGGIGMLAAADEAALASRDRAGPFGRRARRSATRRSISSACCNGLAISNSRCWATGTAQVRALFERDCSLQRRHQKVVEESPAPGLPRPELDAMAALVAGVLQDLGYDNIGTVEMLRATDGTFNFLEVNTRLQVEHAVTEMVTGIDLVAAMIRSAAGERLADILPETIQQSGHAVEARVYAEDPHSFFPSPGPLTRFRPPASHASLRVETGYAEGCTVTPLYDPLLAKVIAHAPTRPAALDALANALAGFEVMGVKTNIPFLKHALADSAIRAGELHTGMAALLTVARG